MPGYAADKESLQKRLRRIEGQVRGLQRMVDEDTYCIDVLTQISAATRALEAVALHLLEEHMRHCVQEALASRRPGGRREDQRGDGGGSPPRPLMTEGDAVTTHTYTVEGMSCQHCVDAITGEVTKLDGVSAVDVDLDAKTVAVSGDPLDDDAVAAAIDEAGYTVVH